MSGILLALCMCLFSFYLSGFQEGENVFVNLNFPSSAATQNDRKAVESLLSAKGDINAPFYSQDEYSPSEGLNALCLAAYYGWEDLIQKICWRGANPNYIVTDSIVFKGHTPLHIAILKGHADTVEKLLQCGASVNASVVNENSHFNKFTPLDIATYLKDEKTQLVLMRHSAKRASTHISLPTTSTSSSTSTSIVQKNKIDQKLEKDYETGKLKNAETPLIKAIRLGDIGGAAKYIEKNMFINIRVHRPGRELDDFTPLCLAVYLGQPIIVDLLCSHGAELDAFIRNPESLWAGYSALHMAVRLPNANVLETLLKYYKNDPKLITIQTQKNGTDWDSGFTPLFIAAYYGNAPAIRALCQQSKIVHDKIYERHAEGTSTRITEWAGYNALHMAVKRNNYDAVVALLDCGARNNILVQAPSSPFDGFSPLCLAVLNNNEQIAAEIIKHGVHINYPIITENHEGFANYTVLALARYNANVGMVKMLHKSGANINQLKAVKNVIYRPGASAQNIDEVSAYLKSCVGTSSSL